MKILLVNDDGIYAEGLLKMAGALAKNDFVEKIMIVAPSKEQSGMSQALTMGVPLRVKQIKADELNLKDVLAYSVDGTPADCTKLALEVLLKEKPDLIISGINNGGNLGTDVLYSGTVGAGLEGYNHGVPAICVSVGHERSIKMEEIAQIISDNIKRFYQSDKLFMYNINFPSELKNGKVKFVFTKQGRRYYDNEFDIVKLEDNCCAYQMQGRAKDIGNDEYTDIETVKKGFISITPLSLERTDFAKLEELMKSDF